MGLMPLRAKSTGDVALVLDLLVKQTGHRLLIGSQSGAYCRVSPQPFHVAYRWCTEEPLVIAGEVRGVVVAHAIAGTRGVEVVAEHEAAGLLQPQLLLELQG